MKLVYRFGDSPLPSLDQVGGKGLSLMQLFQAGFPVPPGFVLTTAFFEPWIVLLKATPVWKQFLAADPAGLRDVCQRLKAISAGYELATEQKKRHREALIVFDEKTLFAVRSSSPEEDLGSASFAGGYETGDFSQWWLHEWSINPDANQRYNVHNVGRSTAQPRAIQVSIAAPRPLVIAPRCPGV